MALKRDAILNAVDIVTEEVPVPEWGGSVLVRGMNGAERDAYEGSMITGRGKDAQLNIQDARAKLVVACSVDETGAQLFSGADVAALSRKSAIALDRIYEVAARLSGITKEDVEALVKNSVSVPSASSHSV